LEELWANETVCAIVFLYDRVLLQATTVGSDIARGGEGHGPVGGIPPADMIAAFR